MNVPRQHNIEPDFNDFELEEEPAVEQVEASSAEHMKHPVMTPFADGAVTGLFYPGAGRQALLGQLADGLRYGAPLLLVHGDQGVGKQYLVDQMLGGLDPESFSVALLEANVLQGVEQILALLSAAWLAPEPFDGDRLQTQLTQCATAADDESRVLLLVVQRAQHLDPAAVELLTRILELSAGLPVKILLVLDALDPDEIFQLAVLFDQAPDHLRWSLAPLTLSETGEYLEYRLRTGGMGHARFSRQQIERVFNLSLGNLQRINSVASELLRNALAAPRKLPVMPALPWTHAGALLLVVLVVLALLFSGGESGPEAVTPVSQTTVPAAVAPNTGAPLTATKPPEEAVTTGPAPTQQVPGQQVPAQEAPVTSVTAETAPVQPAPVQPAPVQPAPVQPAPVQQSVATTRPVSTPVVAAPTKAMPLSADDARTRWIRSLPADHFALQLLSAREKATVEKFLTLYPSVQQLSYYRTVRNGAPWFVVVQGNYPSREAAQSAVAKLPENLQKQQPWIRKLEAIQKDLEN